MGCIIHHLMAANSQEMMQGNATQPAQQGASNASLSPGLIGRKQSSHGGCTTQTGCCTSGLGHLTEGRIGSPIGVEAERVLGAAASALAATKEVFPLALAIQLPQESYTEAIGCKGWRSLYETDRAGGRVAFRAINVAWEAERAPGSEAAASAAAAATASPTPALALAPSPGSATGAWGRMSRGRGCSGNGQGWGREGGRGVDVQRDVQEGVDCC